ncbi:AAA family ATPase [Kitasatospora sp. NPDC093102]|uniref:AAA family ATPase n=1 Tax=Kitasatospora sp. NPDC093102 TaxID=3155069 RepID=UPI0034156F09
MTGNPLAPPLCGRTREQEELDRLLLDLRRGHSRVLVLRGESGVGKTALLTYPAGRARRVASSARSGWRPNPRSRTRLSSRCALRC